MKLNKFFMLGLAGLAFAACSSDENASDAWNDSKEKSVQVSIANAVHATPESRSKADAFSQGVIAVAKAENLKFLFLAGDQITAVRTITQDVTTTESEEGNNVYTFHNVSGSVNKVAILGNVHSTITIQANSSYNTLINLIKNQNHLTNQQGEISNIVVMGESNNFIDKGTDEHGKVFSAGKIQVIPLLARLEIGEIGCTDLGQTAVEGAIPLYKSLTLAKIGIDNIKTDFSQKTLLTYPEENGEAAWQSATTWCDEITTKLTTEKNTAEKVFVAYNVVPGTTPRIILQINEYEKNDGVVTDVQFPWYVRADQYTGLKGTFEAGKIYQVKYQFKCDNIKPWKPIKSICVEVEVVIPNWTIVELTPEFQ